MVEQEELRNNQRQQDLLLQELQINLKDRNEINLKLRKEKTNLESDKINVKNQVEIVSHFFIFVLCVCVQLL